MLGESKVNFEAWTVLCIAMALISISVVVENLVG